MTEEESAKGEGDAQRSGAEARPDLLERVRAVDAELVDGPGAFGAFDASGSVSASMSAAMSASTALSVDELIAALGHSDAKTRARAAAGLAGVGDAKDAPRVVKALRAAAGDAVPEVRAVALAAIVKLSPDKLLPEIVKSLRAQDGRVVAGAAVVLGHAARLGSMGVRSAVPNLVEAFQTDEAAVGRAVAWALGRIGEKAVVPWLVAALEQGFAAAAAAEALGRIGDPRATPALLAALSDADADVRAAAARALGRTVSLGNAANTVNAVNADADADGVVPRLELLLTDPSPRVRLSAALALYERGEGAALASALGLG